MVYDSVPPGGTLVAAVDFVTERSADGAAVTGTPVAELLPLPALGSDVALATEAELAIVPLALPETVTVSVKVAVAPLASVAALQVIVPVVPTEGVVQEKPAGVVID
jgi:hypothetical protein